MKLRVCALLVLTLATIDVSALQSLSHGLGLNAGGFANGPARNGSHFAVPTKVLRCVKNNYNRSLVSFQFSGWAPTPSYYNISALVESVRSARDVGLTVWLSLAFDELHLTPKQVVPTLKAITAAGLATAVERVFLFVEGDPIIWNGGRRAIGYMFDAIKLVQELHYDVGVQSNSVQWSWITANMTQKEQQRVGKLPFWYDCGSPSPEFDDFSQYSSLHSPTGPWDHPTAKTYVLESNITACGYDDHVRQIVYVQSPALPIAGISMRS